VSSIYDAEGRDLRGEQLAMGMQIKDPADKRRWIVIAGWQRGSNQHERIALVYRAAKQDSRDSDLRTDGDNGCWTITIKVKSKYTARKR
jgi:hypothetical protein